ncbi:MAG: TonB-dependent receptor domain-containing protein [bacterium]
MNKEKNCTFYSRIASFVILALLGLVSTSGYAQTSRLRGRVADVQSGETLPGANVVVTSGSVRTGAATSSTGEFELADLPADTYTITISFIGYMPDTLSNVTLAAGETRSLTIALQPTSLQSDPVVVSASRHPEKRLEAPAAVTVLESRAIESQMALTPADHLKAITGVDVITAGLNQSRVVIRGFNDLLSGSLLSMVDNRITRIPAVRLNAFQVIPTSSMDVERIEVVAGPASALYGPNSANGVMHVLTKSPFESRGTLVGIGGGERDVRIGTLRHAGIIHQNIGYKLSVQRYTGRDFEYLDPVEQRFRAFALRNADVNGDSLRIGARVFDIKSTTLDARVDVRLRRNLTFNLNSGFSKGDNIEITDQGAAQALDARFTYWQARLFSPRFFVQGYINKVGTGDTYFLRSGQSIINNSSLMVAQAQHNFFVGRHQHFTYGLDILLTRPDTEGTVNGRNEAHDNVDELGVYLQSETTLSPKFKLVTAARIDDHNRLEGVNFSPRASLTFKPTPKDHFRLTFNRAFTTPTSDMLFADNSGGAIRTEDIDPDLVPFFGDTLTNVRALGAWPAGYTFSYGPDHRPEMITAFQGYFRGTGIENRYLPAGVDPIHTWSALRDFFVSGANEAQSQLLAQLLPDTLSRGVPGILKILNTESPDGEFKVVDASFVRNIKSVFASTNTTFEFGYKGLIKNRLLASIDIYHTRIKDFIGPLRVVTPNVFINTDSLEAVLADDIARRITGLPPEQAAALAAQIAHGIAQNPGLDSLSVGIVSPLEVRKGTDIILTYRNLGNVSITGVDFSLAYQLNQNWTVAANYSFVNRGFFRGRDRFSNISLNAPRHKVGVMVDYRNHRAGFEGNLRLRFVDSFRALSGTFDETIERYAIFDFNASYRLPFSHNTRITVTVQNLLNKKHKEFAGVPEIGRLAWVRLTQTL